MVISTTSQHSMCSNRAVSNFSVLFALLSVYTFWKQSGWGGGWNSLSGIPTIGGGMGPHIRPLSRPLKAYPPIKKILSLPPLTLFPMAYPFPLCYRVGGGGGIPPPPPFPQLKTHLGVIDCFFIHTYTLCLTGQSKTKIQIFFKTGRKIKFSKKKSQKNCF